jgi:hypothetical protein
LLYQMKTELFYFKLESLLLSVTPDVLDG